MRNSASLRDFLLVLAAGAALGARPLQASAETAARRPNILFALADDWNWPHSFTSGVKSGMNPSEVQLPACLPDSPEIRSDLCDYYWEVQRYDASVGELLRKLEAAGELENTLVVMTGDNGLPFPRCKSNLYDTGAKVPLAIRWSGLVKPGRVVSDFVSLADLAPTFLEAAGVKPPADMTARSLADLLRSDRSGQIDPSRDHVLAGKERHCQAQAKGSPGGYPCRAIHTADPLYIRNFKPDRWPAGVAQASDCYGGMAYHDIDMGPSKTYMIAHKDDPAVQPLFTLGFGKRPAEELYDLKKDRGQLVNVAFAPGYAAVKNELSGRLMAELAASRDPRVLGNGDRFDTYADRK